MRQMSVHADEWCGIPTPIPDIRLIVEDKHPASKLFASFGKEEPFDGTLVNRWFNHQKRSDVYLWRDSTKKLKWGIDPGVHHIKQDFMTLYCSVAWSIEAEEKALQLLRTLIPDHLFKGYCLTGMFPQTSKRSGVSYLFRRLKPTVAIKATKGDHEEMKILCCLCLHSIGYYEDTWAGAMCPTDDVISHLLLMRGDEHMFWKRANQIPPWRPEAGL